MCVWGNMSMDFIYDVNISKVKLLALLITLVAAIF